MANLIKTGIITLGLLLFIGCDDNSMNTDISLEDEINMGRPYNNIIINFQSDNISSESFNNDDYQEARAEEGFLIISFESGNRSMYNLDTVREVSINPGIRLDLTY